MSSSIIDNEQMEPFMNIGVINDPRNWDTGFAIQWKEAPGRWFMYDTFRKWMA